jgi:biotin carboxylase
MKTLRDIRRRFACNETPIYYFNTTPFNLLGAEEWMGGLRFINTIDSFAGQHARVFVPSDAAAQRLAGFESANHYLLTHAEVKRFVQPGGKALFLMFDEQHEADARMLGLQVCLPAAALRQHLDSKVVTTELAHRAGVAAVPHVLAPVKSYAELRRVASDLGRELVVQLPYGDSGNTTFFMADENDFRAPAAAIAAQPVVKIMRRIRCRQLTIEGCVTRHGTLVGPLQTELVGCAELTPFGGGWCGNEVFACDQSALLTPDVRQHAQHATLALGEQLRPAGYRGCFGLDFLLDQDTGRLYLGEMNPRITGATPMTNQAMLEADSVPLLLFHLLEWFGARYEVEVAAFNQQWLRAEGISSWSQMILEQTDDDALITAAPATGLWQMRADGSLQFVRSACSPSALTEQSEALFLRTVNVGQAQPNGASLGRVVLRGRLLTDEYQLNERAQAWIHGFKAHFQTQPLETAQGVRA